MRTATLALAMIAALTLAGCDKFPSGGGAAGPVAATVDGHKITVAQLDAELKAAGVPNATDPELRRAALQKIVARTVLADYARKQKLEATPEAKLLKAAQVATFEANLAQQDAVDKAAAPTPAEVAAFVAAHPELFAARKIYLVEQLILAQRPDAGLSEALKPVSTFEDVKKVLISRNVAFQPNTVQVDPLRIDPRLSAQLAAMAPGTAFVLPNGQNLSIAQVRMSRPAPISGPEATQVAGQMLAGQAKQKAVADRMEGLLKAAEAKTTYGEGFAPPKPATPAS